MPATPGTVERFIELVRGIESIYPTWSAARLNDELRVLGGYGGGNFAIALGDPRPFSTLLTDLGSANSSLSYKNILLELKGYMKHGFSNGVETGVVKDARGVNVAIGHVITGIAGGIKNSNPAPGLPPGLQKVPTMTLTGDLGQTAAKRVNGLNPRLGASAPGQFGGVGSEATAAELVGDVDGMLLGTYLYGTPKVKL